MLQWIVLALGLYLCARKHWFVGLLLVLISGRWLAAAVGVLLLALAAAALMSASDSTPSDIRTAERPMEPLSAPRGPEPVSYGVGDAAFAAWLAAPNVHGRPAAGLEATAVADGMDGYNVAAGVAGEDSVARMLASMGIRDAHVFLSCRNPGDATGRADIDVVVVSGRTVWLLDAKHYRPASPDAYLVPTPGLDAMRGGGGLRAYDSNTNLNVPVGSLAGVAPVRTYHASGNMAWATDSVRSGLPAGLDVRPVVLLSRTTGGVYGVMRGTMFPGAVPVMQADAWASTFTDAPADPRAVGYFWRLLKS